jgi:hypothetical protein
MLGNSLISALRKDKQRREALLKFDIKDSYLTNFVANNRVSAQYGNPLIFNLGFPRSKWLIAEINHFLSKLPVFPADLPQKKAFQCPLIVNLFYPRL